jgi:hypothetical protein
MSVAVFITVFRLIQRSRIGRAFVAIRITTGAEVMGISVYRYKLPSFFLCSVYGVRPSLVRCMDGYQRRSFRSARVDLVPGNADRRWDGQRAGAIFGAILIRSLNRW